MIHGPNNGATIFFTQNILDGLEQDSGNSRDYEQVYSALIIVSNILNFLIAARA